MEIIERKITEIHPYYKNSKEHPKKQIKQIADSISEFGFNQPIVVDKQGIIIVGHGRYLAAQLLGKVVVPVLEVDIDEEHAKAYRLAETKKGWHYSQMIIWLKNSLVFSYGCLFHRIYEPCMVLYKEGKQYFKNSTFSNFEDVWTLDQKKFQDYLDVWYQKRDNTSTYIHPTQKPVQLAERAIKRSSEIDDIVLDAFGGSGSTMIACEQ